MQINESLGSKIPKYEDYIKKFDNLIALRKQNFEKQE